MKDHLLNLYLGNRFFAGLGIVAVLSAMGFWQEWLYVVAVGLLVLLVGWTLFDAYLLYRMAGRVEAERFPPKVFSLGDEMNVRIRVKNLGKQRIYAELTDEAPVQLQLRDQRIPLVLEPGARREIAYQVHPLTRGVYSFGWLNIFLRSRFQLVERRWARTQEQSIAVYPSIVQMKQFALQSNTTVIASGRKRLRRLTKSYEFDQIKEYVVGDDYRNINWRATGRRAELMVNQYEEERAQRIYCFIDKGRTMLMPFKGLSLLDYAINASLALSNVILKRQDRAGLITFSDKIGNVLPADAKPDQLRRILETLYRQEEREGESDYNLLYYAARKLLGGRSLVLLFTNFESNYALDRVLPGLRRIARMHKVVVILFENTEVAELLEETARDVEDVYRKNSARRYLQERELMAARLRQNGIGVVLTRPEELTGAVINKYLEVKAQGGI